jgi:hypothetical protein
MATYDPRTGTFEDYWNRQFRTDPEMQRIHAAEVARERQSRADARASGRGGRRGLGFIGDKETAATARARAMGWAPPDHDWSVDFTDDGFRTEKANYFTRNKDWILPAAMATVGGVAAWPTLFGGGAAAGGTAAAPLLQNTVTPQLLALGTTAAPAAMSATVPAFAGYVGGTTAAKAGGGAMNLGRKALGWLSTDEASAAGKIGAWGFDRWGQKKQDEVLAEDKVAWDARYQAQLDLLATQRAEDMALDAERETRLQARWQAGQDQRQAIWDARETQMEPYRKAGHQSLARVANVQPPTRPSYRSRFMA